MHRIRHQPLTGSFLQVMICHTPAVSWAFVFLVLLFSKRLALHVTAHHQIHHQFKLATFDDSLTLHHQDPVSLL